MRTIDCIKTCNVFVSLLILTLSAMSISLASPKGKTATNIGKRAVRKGILGFTGTSPIVHKYHRQFTSYSHDEMLVRSGTRYRTPADKGYATEDFSHETYPIGVTYIPSAQDKNPALLDSKKFKYVVTYSLRSFIKDTSIEDVAMNLPQAAAIVGWNGMQSTGSSKSVAVSPNDYTFTLNLGPFGSYSIPTTVFHAPVPKTDGGTFTETYELPDGNTEPSAFLKRTLNKQMKSSAKIHVDGGLNSHADALAEIKVFVLDNKGYGGYKQFSVKEAFNYSGAIR